MDYQVLEWDSSLLEKKVAKVSYNIKSADKLHNVLLLMRKKGVVLAYYESKKRIPLKLEQYFNGKLVDIKTTFITNLINNKLSYENIKPYESSINIYDMERLSIQSGIYSRFNMDPDFPKDKYIKLYTTWIKKSISKELAKEVLTLLDDNIVIGMITLGEQNKRGDIGLIAVDNNHRGKGYGKSLITAAHNWFINHGYKTGQVITQERNISACKLYTKCGYHIENKSYFYHFWL